MRIAITGTIGSGKSTVVSYIKEKGYKVFDCDKYAHDLLKDSKVFEEITSQFDCIENGEISRKKLGGIVFNDRDKLEILNGIIHPRVKLEILNLELPIFVDIPLLFESNMEEMFDVIITVCASEELIIKRLSARDEMSEKEARKRISLQIDEKIKKSKSDYVIINDDTISKLYAQIDIVLGGIKC